MKNLRFLIKFLVLVSLAAFQAPAMVTTSQAAGLQTNASAATSIALTFTNPLPKATTVTLTGKRSYTINALAGATITQNIEADKYKFSYTGCLGKTKKGNLKIKGTAATLKIAPCKMATWTFYNADNSRSATINLKGWMNYSVTVGPGQVKQFTWVADSYQATLVACGKTHNFTWKVKGKKSWIVYAC